ncbi:alpha/beta hydrolase [Pararhizobium mangrovi]|uniref:alpha/beta hydrolase n=1 Tax=Pararhizobium mangrovi TaxID=2590452 RepID=UPI001F3E968D|nr:alpha/beta hydrolase [Pararhizobium mangrovi]
MQRRPFCLVLALCLLFVAAAAHAQERRYDGVPYAGPLALDIYVPAGPLEPLPQRKRGVVVYVHGGGWLKGDRKHVYKIPEFITSLGYVFVAMDYRLVPETDIEGQTQDVARAINWVSRNIADYGGDPNRIAIMGHSAGSHLVTMVAARHLVNVRAVIADDVQAYDMVAYDAMRGSLGYPYKQAFGEDPADWRKWSPITYARTARNVPPHLMMYSGSNGERRQALTTEYARVLSSRGTYVYVFDGSDYTHGTIARYLGRLGDRASGVVAQFLKRTIGR